MSIPASTRLVFSDLDGSLLDHYSYEFQDARPALLALERSAIPLILASSKTRAEILRVREALGNSHPFIVENGAAVHIPLGYFPRQPQDTEVQGEFWVHAMAQPRICWLNVLSQLESEFPAEFDSFHTAGIAGIMQMTGLSEAQAILANQRDYSEPVKWWGLPAGESRFIQRLEGAGATVLKGGRFLSVSGNCDKGRALRWLRACYQEAADSGPVEDLAIGDSENDRTMLEAARTALVIRSPAHGFPELAKTDRVLHSQDFGPTGWAEGVLRWLNLINLSA